MNAPPVSVLVIDDDESIRLGCVESLKQEGFVVRSANNGKAGLELAREEAFDVAIVDLKMPGIGGMTVLERLRQDAPDTQVIMITGYATIESAVVAIRMGAYDYLPKPFSVDMLNAVVKRAIERRRLAFDNEALRLALRQSVGEGAMIGDSEVMQEVARLIRRVAPTDATVLIFGKTGVGKEIAARAIHDGSPRRDRLFVPVDCGALVEGLFENELFGHVRGAYSGAVEASTGKFELANGGTIFLDEISNISLEMQAKLLRVIQEREVTKVGGTQRVKIDVRIVAATNNDLIEEMRAGRFREDLFYRLSVVPIHLPPLCERRGDIVPLALHFLQKHGSRRNRSISVFSDEALAMLEQYNWPGNVRELENAVERALVMADPPRIDPGDLMFYGSARAGTDTNDKGGEGHLVEVEKREIRSALERFDGQINRTADFLGINRKTLREKMKRYGLASSSA
jgi:DNA-binding NtrC family response regulator